MRSCYDQIVFFLNFGSSEVGTKGCADRANRVLMIRRLSKTTIGDKDLGANCMVHNNWPIA